MEIIDRIPVAPDPTDMARRLRFSPGRGGFGAVEEIIDTARSMAGLRTLYDVSFVGEKGEGTVEVGGVVFRSRVLRRNLEGVQKVFPYIMTVGPELERAASSSGDLLRQYYLEEMANVILEQGIAWLSRTLGDRWGFPALSNMSPGSIEDWPITEQTGLFSLFGKKERAIGVKLTESLLMLPRKSISGVLFPSEEGFHACRLCPRENCPSRKAPYDAAAF